MDLFPYWLGDHMACMRIFSPYLRPKEKLRPTTLLVATMLFMINMVQGLVSARCLCTSIRNCNVHIKEGYFIHCCDY